MSPSYNLSRAKTRYEYYVADNMANDRVLPSGRSTCNQASGMHGPTWLSPLILHGQKYGLKSKIYFNTFQAS